MRFKFPRARTVSSLSGHVIAFEKNELTHVPPAMHKEVIAAGGIPEGELDDDEDKKPEAPQGDERVQLIRMAMEDLVATNVSTDFTAAGAPHTKKLAEKLGFKVTNAERDEIWASLRQD